MCDSINETIISTDLLELLMVLCSILMQLTYYNAQYTETVLLL